MSDVDRLLMDIENGDSNATAELFTRVYAELRKLAGALMAQEVPGHSLQATGLVHEAYLRLVGADQKRKWDTRGHFFVAAAEAMRRILVENARSKGRQKRGGDWRRQELELDAIAGSAQDDELLAVNEALDKLQATNSTAAELVKLRYFAGFTIPECAEKLGMSPRKADQIWAYARAWLKTEICEAAEEL